MAKKIVVNDYYNALYGDDGTLEQEGKPEYLDGETLARVMPDAELYVMPQDVYDDVLDGAGYPQTFTSLPVPRLQRVR